MVDCDGCTAPCCKQFAVFHSETLADQPETITRQTWMEAGAILRFVDESEGGHRRFDCQALVNARCAVYEKRPMICQGYDCRDDAPRSDGEHGAQCAWPR